MKKMIMAVVFCMCLAIASYAIAQCSMDLGGAAEKAVAEGEAVAAEGTEVVDEAAVVAENAVQEAAPVAAVPVS
jgi:hypothetical protein